MTIIGYYNQASGIADYLALVVIILHMLITVGHTLLVVYHRESSGCWDAIPEMLALAQNSRPAYKALKNTGAGVKKGSTFARKAKVRATGIHDCADVDHLNLLFDAAEEDAHLGRNGSSGSATPMISGFVPSRGMELVEADTLYE